MIPFKSFRMFGSLADFLQSAFVKSLSFRILQDYFFQETDAEGVEIPFRI